MRFNRCAMTSHSGIIKLLLPVLCILGGVLFYQTVFPTQNSEVALQSTSVKVTVVALVTATPSSLDRLHNARIRWQKNRVLQYKMDVNYTHLRNTDNTNGCSQSIQVNTVGNIVSIEELQNNCVSPLLPFPTVENLFRFTERITHSIESQCGANGCGCDGRLILRASYHPSYSYPVRIRAEISGVPTPGFLPPTPNADGIIWCTALGHHLEEEFFATLTPLP
jgi:hypothetical protein